MTIGFASGAGDTVGMVGAGAVVGTARANVLSQYTDALDGAGRAGMRARYVMRSAILVVS